MSTLRLPDVLRETGHRSQVSIYSKIKIGLFPQPVKIGERASGWPEHEVKAICTARAGGATDDEVRELVQLLHRQRAERFQALMGNTRPPEVPFPRPVQKRVVAPLGAA
jgi:prophage regulatory protein